MAVCWQLQGGAQTPGRVLEGRQGAQQIRLQILLYENNEYVQAAELVPYFSGRWKYNAMLESLHFTRADGQRVGLMVGDQRLVIEDRVIYTGNPPLRQGGRILIPLTMVYPHLFPNVDFTEASAEDEAGSQIAQRTTPTPPLYIFQENTPTPTPPSTPTRAHSPVTPAKPTPSVTQQEPGEKMVVMIDPGQSPAEPGPTAPNGLSEAELTLVISEKLAQILQASNRIEAKLTRHKRQTNPLAAHERAAIANAQEAQLFISLHCGALNTDEISRGAVYFMNPVKDVAPSREMQKWAATYQLNAWHEGYKNAVSQSRELAGLINRQLASLYEITNIIQMDSNPRPGRLHVLRGLTMPAAFVELGNIKHPTTASFLSSDIRQTEIAQHLADAVTAFLRQRF